MTAPRSAADPRPGGKPYYIDPNCPTCGTPLVLDDLLRDPNTPEDTIFHDEWICPNHVEEGAFLDWPSTFGRSLRTSLKRDPSLRGRSLAS